MPISAHRGIAGSCKHRGRGFALSSHSGAIRHPTESAPFPPIGPFQGQTYYVAAFFHFTNQRDVLVDTHMIMGHAFDIPGCGGEGMKLHYLAGALAVSLLGGCTTVKSERVDSFHASTESSGFTYFLPTRPIRFSATREPATDEKLEKAKKERETDLASAKKSEADAGKAYTTAQALHDAAVSGGADIETIKELRKAMELAAARKSVAEAERKNAQAKLDAATADLAGSVTAKGCRYSSKIELLAPQADPRFRMVASMNHSAFRDDLQTFTVSSAGLLKTADVVATDRSGDILVEAAGLAGRLSTFRPAMTAITKTDEQSCETTPTTFVTILDPLEGVNVEDGNVRYPAIDGLTQRLQDAGFPFTVQIRSDFLMGPPAKDGEPPVFRFAEPSNFASNVGALYYRTPVPVVFNVLAGGPRGTPIASSIVNLPQAGPISSIPMRSSAFVKTKGALVFEDGMLTSWTNDRPSEFAAAVALPGRIVGGFVGGVVQGVADGAQLRDAEADDISSRLTLERIRLQREALVLCVAEAKETEGSDPLACFSDISDTTAED